MTDASGPTDELRETVSVEVQALQSAVDAFDEAAAAVLGVNRTDLRCLELLMQQDSAGPGRLGQALGLTTGSVTTMLDRLERIGYLTRSADPSDRRKVAVRITDEARQKAWELYGPFATEGGEVLKAYSAEELALLAGFLRGSRSLYERHLARVRALPARDRRR
ncbi:MarR family transcriptional regulator [Kitasatospora purpeofusca]|uniref:MarR family winged helix-turn-helix transcriptional regulator n=1 Tax=Kitasatospora purpeofusca TaxID=67352 RepID=UPI0030F1FBA2